MSKLPTDDPTSNPKKTKRGDADTGEQTQKRQRNLNYNRYGEDQYNEKEFDELEPPSAEELRLFAELEAREMADADGNTRSGSGKISGEARSDNDQNACSGRAHPWVCPNNTWPTNPGNPKKRAWRAIQAIPLVFERKPCQSAVMWNATTGKIKTFKDQKIAEGKRNKKECVKAISPNDLAGYASFLADSKGSYEWLHLIANSFGGPDSCSFPNVSLGINPAQVVANLVLGTYAANTFMMAIEFAVDAKVGIHYCVEAFSTDDHVAEWIRVSLCKSACHGAPVGAIGAPCRHYWIDARIQVCPRKAFDHMKADAINFVSSTTGFGMTTTYLYLDPAW